MSRVSKAKSVDVVASVARRLEDLLDEVVFVGGSTAAFLITDESVVGVRPTLDVDLIVEVMNLPAFYQFEKRLLKLGFAPDKDGPRCRYKVDGIIVDVMPDEASILGFTNRWYQAAIDTAETHTVNDMQLRVVSAPLFLATKLEAHYGRSAGDYLGSHDLEDVLAVIDGRPSIVTDCFDAPDAVKTYLCEAFAELLADDEFVNVVPGFVEQAQAEERAAVLLARMGDLVNALDKKSS